MWVNTDIEECMKKGLEENLNKSDAEFYYGLYTTAKQELCRNIYSEIKGVEPQLTDHSERHIQNVLDRAWKLIIDNDRHVDFNAIELYLLCTCILFHDVGNIYGRVEHNINVADIYNSIRGDINQCSQERQLVLRVVRAHCGKTKDGGKDTLFEVEPNSNLYDQPVRVRELAAILRFADELAEGVQRTSQYMINKGLIQKDSLVFHKYASVSEYHIDKGEGRIVLMYNIDYPLSDISLKDLLEFVYKRILKLDAERRYCKYYASSLQCFLCTEASIKFTVNGDLCDFDLPKISLEDKYNLVDDGIEDLIRKLPALKIDEIESKLLNNLKS